MSFDWNEFIKLGDIFRKVNNSDTYYEAYWRTSISRIYYGVFIILRNYIRDTKNIQLPKFNIHSFVENKLLTSQNINEKIIGKELNVLMRKRGDADYEDVYRINEKELSCVYARSQKILSLYNQLSQISNP